MLPTFFLALGAVTLLAAIVAFWQSARLLFSPIAALDDAALDSADRASLLEQKAAVLRSLKDLELDRSTGKIGEADFAKLEAEHRARAKEILRALAAETSPFRVEAEKLVDDALAKSAAAPKKKAAKPKAAAKKAEPAEDDDAPSAAKATEDDDARPAAKAAAPEPEPATRAESEADAEPEPDAEPGPDADGAAKPADARPECAKCGTANDADAAFCKKCGTKLGAEAAS